MLYIIGFKKLIKYETVLFPIILRSPKKVENAVSITGRATYSGFFVDEMKIHFKRDNTQKKWAIDLDALFDILNTQEFINYTILKDNMKGRIYSPSWATLVAAGFYSHEGLRIAPNH